MGNFSQSIRRNLIKTFRDQKFRTLWMWLPITLIYSFHNIAILSQKSKRSTSAQYLILSEKRLKTTWKHLHLRGFGQILSLDRHTKCISESTKHHFPFCCFLRADHAYRHIPKKEWGQNSSSRLVTFVWVLGGPNITRTKNYLVLWKSNIALLKKRLSDMLKKEIFVQVQKVACSMKGEFAVSELLKCHPGDRDGILVSPTSKKCCFFGLTSSIFSWRNFVGSPFLSVHIRDQQVEVIFRPCDISSPPDPLKP